MDSHVYAKQVALDLQEYIRAHPDEYPMVKTMGEQLGIEKSSWNHIVHGHNIVRSDPTVYARLFYKTGLESLDPRKLPPTEQQRGSMRDLKANAWSEECWQAWLEKGDQTHPEPIANFYNGPTAFAVFAKSGEPTPEPGRETVRHGVARRPRISSMEFQATTPDSEVSSESLASGQSAVAPQSAIEQFPVGEEQHQPLPTQLPQPAHAQGGLFETLVGTLFQFAMAPYQQRQDEIIANQRAMINRLEKLEDSFVTRKSESPPSAYATHDPTGSLPSPSDSAGLSDAAQLVRNLPQAFQSLLEGDADTRDAFVQQHFDAIKAAYLILNAFTRSRQEREQALRLNRERQDQEVQLGRK